MKNQLSQQLHSWALGLAIGLGGALCDAQQAIQTQTSAPPSMANGDYAIVGVGPDSRLWKNASGQSVTEIASGMNYWDGQQWRVSDPAFRAAPDGSGFVAEKLQDPTKLAANLNCAGAVSVSTPDGLALRSTPLAIALYDAASGQSVVVATLTNSIGVAADPQDIVYDRAFVGGGFAASVVYSLPDAGSFHQDVIFTAFDPAFDPTTWGFAASSTNTLQIQIFTEFYNPPQPTTIMRPLYVEQDPTLRARMASPDFIDYTLDFGDYVFGPGRAYAATTSDDPGAGVTVAKSFITSNGRTFLVESIPFRSLQAGLRSLPPLENRTSMLKRNSRAGKTRMAGLSVPAPSQQHPVSLKMVASTNPRKGRPRGVDIDYVVTVSSTVVPTLYASDTTYYVSGTVHNSSAVTMESAVFKYPTNNAGAIEISGPLTLTTTNYRPAIFTAADDNTAGASLSTTVWSNYTGNPSGKYYGNVALWLNTTANIALNNLRFCYARMAIEISADTANQIFSLAHSQLVNCINGIYVSGGNGSGSGSGSDTLAMNANNCLMANVEYPFQTAAIGLTGVAYNCTIDTATYLLQFDSATSGTFSFTNSIFSAVTSKGTLNSVTLAGGYNGFYSSPTFGSAIFSASSNPYQPVAAGNYYLSPSSVLCTNGTTNVGGALLSQLQGKTTQAPQVLTNWFTANATLTPVAQRDVTGPIIGYHYDPLDYVAACSVSNATLLLTNGVAMAYYDNLGIWLQDGAQLVSQGSPIQRNYLVYYGLVQDQPVNLWGVTNALAQSLPICPLPFGATAYPSASLRLTTISAPTGQTNLLNSMDKSGSANSNQVVNALTLRDCEVYGSGANWQMSETNNTPSVALNNNVFYRVPFAINSQAKVQSFNNLFYAATNVSTNLTTISIRYHSGSSPNTNQDNVFDGVTASLDGVVGYNGYIHGATNTTFQSSDIRTNLTWISGPLGNYYQASNSPFINLGSASAANLGLYHYTVMTNLVSGWEIKETNSTVDLGYHYVAVDSNNIPISAPGDGIPDYLADINGNGIVDPGEISWSNYFSINGLTVPNGLTVFTPLK